MNPLLERISAEPDFFYGTPHIRGQRIWVSVILELLAGGTSVPAVLKVYPTINELDVRAAIAYGAEMCRSRHAITEDALRNGPQCRRQRPPPMVRLGTPKPRPARARVSTNSRKKTARRASPRGRTRPHRR